MAPKRIGRFVVVTTEHRGVFFGYLEAKNNHAPERVTLAHCQMCVSWSSSVRGVVGLASAGPNNECRVTDPATSAEIWKITGIFDCSDNAVSNWEAKPWK